jgi:hypothetical protein
VVEQNPTVLQKEAAKSSAWPPLPLRNIILWKASILEEECLCGAHSEKQNNCTM